MTWQSKYSTYFFVGIGGVGMSALARFIHAQGCRVIGYDRSQSPLCKDLENLGIAIVYAEETGILNGVDLSDTLMVYTAAMPSGSFWMNWAHETKTPTQKRAKLLAEICSDTHTIAIGGTHGKTTITAICSHLFCESNESVAGFVGAVVNRYGSNYLQKNPPAKYTVVEADEFDRSFLNLSPDTTVLSSMDADHLDIYENKENVEKAYTEFAEKTRKNGVLIYKYGLHLPENRRKFTYGIDQGADFCAQNIQNNGEGGQTFEVVYLGNCIGSFTLPMAGLYNVENATAAIAVGVLSGIEIPNIINALSTFPGIYRRMEKMAENSQVLYFDDYAHHPTEITAVLSSLRASYPSRAIHVIFQPHLFSRTRDFLQGFADSLSKADTVWLLDIYPARELPIDGISSSLLASLIPEKCSPKVVHKKAFPALLSGLTGIVVTLGAGDIDTLRIPITKFIENV
jgi:UDP-N-acetylmuramate--alanine ligase